MLRAAGGPSRSAQRRLLATLFTVPLVVSACSGTSTEATTTQPSAPATTTTAAPTTSTEAPAATTTTVAGTTTTAAPTTTTTTTTTLPPDPLQGLGLELVASGLFQPTAVASPPGDDRLFVVERNGRIRIVDASGLVEQPFLDIESSVAWGHGIEIGMLGLAFHPGFADNGRFFVYYTDTGDDRRLVEFEVSDDPSMADPSSETLLLTRPQPTETIRHYGGHLEFGPDGMLYAALGDGAAHDLNGQDPGTVFGAILRLDVDQGDTYAIPADNPFATGGGAGEVWAYGLRNPWRFSIDTVSGTMHIGDVGQENWEEIDRVSLAEPGANFGWPDTEGARCFLLSGCNLDDYELPWIEYSHAEGCSVTGGRVYRGSAIPELDGHYFYADWCGQWIRSADESGEVTDWSGDLPEAGQVQSFGTDAQGELYITNFAGELWKIVPVR